MTLLFGRRIEVECGMRTAINNPPIVFGNDFDIEFEYRRNDSSTIADTASITLWNAGASLGDLFQNLSKDTYVRISGGYEGREGVLFMGDVTQVDPIQDGPDTGWRVIVGDSTTAINVPFVKSYRPQMNTQKIVDDIIDTMKEAGATLAAGMKGVMTAAIGASQEGGLTAIRKSAGAALKQILDKASVEPRLINEEIYIVDKTTGELRDYSMDIGPTTGLIGSPKASTRTEKDNKVTEGIIFTCLILPDIFPGRRVNIESKRINGSYVVREVTAKGGNRSADWTMEVFAA